MEPPATSQDPVDGHHNHDYFSNMGQDASGCDEWQQVPRFLLLSPALRWQERRVAGNHFLPKNRATRKESHDAEDSFEAHCLGKTGTEAKECH